MVGSIVQNIAYKLFLSNTDILEYEVTEHEFLLLRELEPNGYYLKNDKLIFLSCEERDNYVAYHYSQEIGETYEINKNIIILTAFKIWEQSLRRDQTVAGLFLSLYEDKINVLQSLLLNERSPYEITSLADQFIKHSKELDIQKLFHFASTIYKENNQYLGIYSSLEERLSSNPIKCHEIIEYIYSNIQPESLQLYNIALFSLKKHHYIDVIDILIQDIEKNDITLSPRSMWVLGKIIEVSNSQYRNNEIAELINKNTSSPMTLMSNAAIQATVDSVVTLSAMRLPIRSLLESNNQYLIEALSLKLYLTKKLSSHCDFSFWLSYICKTQTNNNDVINYIFHILSHLAEDESKHELLINCLLSKMRSNSLLKDSKRIEHLIYAIQKKPTLVNKLFTLSLIDEEFEVTAFANIVSTYYFVHRSEHQLEFCIDTINNFTTQDFIFLVRRLLGFISDEMQLVSLTLSLLQVKNYQNRTYNLVKEVILNEIAMDYPNYVRDEIKNRLGNLNGHQKKIKKLYNDILVGVENYLSSFTALPMTKEFLPSSMLVHNFQNEKGKVMARNTDLNKEDSFISQLATQIILKAGVGSFYYDGYLNKGYSEPSYLHSFPSSYSLPRRYIMDNIGYEISQAQYRCAKKDIS